MIQHNTPENKALNELMADLISPFVNKPGENDPNKWTIRTKSELKKTRHKAYKLIVP